MNLWGPPIHAFLGQWQRAVKGKTWPAWRPHSQLDHILVRGLPGARLGGVARVGVRPPSGLGAAWRLSAERRERPGPSASWRSASGGGWPAACPRGPRSADPFTTAADTVTAHRDRGWSWLEAAFAGRRPAPLGPAAARGRRRTRGGRGSSSASRSWRGSSSPSFFGPRVDHPTLSSLYDSATTWPRAQGRPVLRVAVARRGAGADGERARSVSDALWALLGAAVARGRASHPPAGQPARPALGRWSGGSRPTGRVRSSWCCSDGPGSAGTSSPVEPRAAPDPAGPDRTGDGQPAASSSGSFPRTRAGRTGARRRGSTGRKVTTGGQAQPVPTSATAPKTTRPATAPDDPGGDVPAGHRGPHRGREDLVDHRPERRGDDPAGERPQRVAGEEGRIRARSRGGPRSRRWPTMATATVRPAAEVVGQPPADQQPGQAGGRGDHHHGGGERPRDVADVLGVDEHEAVGRPGDHRHREADHAHEHQAAAERAPTGPSTGSPLLRQRSRG